MNIIIKRTFGAWLRENIKNIKRRHFKYVPKKQIVPVDCLMDVYKHLEKEDAGITVYLEDSK